MGRHALILYACSGNQTQSSSYLHIAILRPSNRLNSGYLRYYLDCAETRKMLKAGYVSGSAIPRVVLKDFRRAPIPLPPLKEQQAIACILGALDDKIELNRRMNRTLEATARAIFKSWFIDFDPLRRNAAKGRNQPSPPAPLPEAEGRKRTLLPLGEGGRRPGEDSVESLNQLFPDAFEDSELGEIPKGWRVGCLGDVAEHPRRSVQSKHMDSNMPYIALEHMPRRCIALSVWDHADKLESNKFEFRNGEILFGKLRPYFH